MRNEQLPYKGLEPFKEEDTEFFFGRSREIELINAYFTGTPLTILFGPSGVGKSSILQAGVLARLRTKARTRMADKDDLTPPSLPIYIRNWGSNPVETIITELQRTVHDECRIANIDMPDIKQGSQDCDAQESELVSAIQSATHLIRGTVLILLDQFEDYFTYNTNDDSKDPLVQQLTRALKHPKLQARFLIAIREDCLGKLTRFKRYNAGFFDRVVRLRHLTRKAATEAIVGPLNRYNEIFSTNESPIQIEPSLVSIILDEIENASKDEVLWLGDSKLNSADNSSEERIEAPYLQLVMQRLWETEKAQWAITKKTTARCLRVETYNKLNGAQNIVQNHVASVLSKLTPREIDTAASIFYWLVTPSGTKVAYPVLEIADRSCIAPQDVADVVRKLTDFGARILKPIGTAGLDYSPDMRQTFEVFHDLLCRPIYEWRRQYVSAGFRQGFSESFARALMLLERATDEIWYINFTCHFGAIHIASQQIRDQYAEYTGYRKNLADDVDDFYNLLCEKVTQIQNVQILTISKEFAIQNFINPVRQKQIASQNEGINTEAVLCDMERCKSEIIALRKNSPHGFNLFESDSIPIQLLIVGLRDEKNRKKMGCLAFMVGTEVLKGENYDPQGFYSEDEAVVRIFKAHASALISAGKRIN